MKAKVDAAKADIIAGKIKVVDYMADNSLQVTCSAHGRAAARRRRARGVRCAASTSASARCTPTARCDLTVAAGTVHGIVGENGAGKSTLMSILYGFYQADSGEIEIEGKPARIARLARRDRAGHRHGAPALHAGRHASARSTT